MSNNGDDFDSGVNYGGMNADQWDAWQKQKKAEEQLNAEKWAAHRKGLVDQLKAKNPKRYDELKEAKDL